jgi:nucleoside-diphosphate-sugar epimerase
MDLSRVLVTGMSGLIGTAVRRRLEGRYTLRALNRRPLAGVDCHQGDIADLDAILPAFAGQDAVVHLAAFLGDDWESVLKYNLRGTYNVFEAARRSGVKRVVFASSGTAVIGYEQHPPYADLAAGRYDQVPPTWPLVTDQAPIYPMGLYGCSKVWGEALGRHYAQAHGLSVLCLRLGRVNPEDRPTQPREYAAWCSQRDAAQMVERCLAAPAELRFEIFYVASDNRWAYRSLANARRLLGYAPQDSAEDYRQG